jgi:hypothetical protein
MFTVGAEVNAAKAVRRTRALVARKENLTQCKVHRNLCRRALNRLL